MEALADADFDANDPSGNPEALAALSEIGEKIDQAELNRATENIDAFFEENCPAG